MKLSKILYFVSVSILVVYLNFFYLFPLPGTFGMRTNMIIPMLMIDFVFVFSIFLDKKFLGKSLFANPLIFILVFLFADVIYTLIKYPNQSMYPVFAEFSTYTCLLSYFIFVKGTKHRLDKFIYVLLLLTSVVAALFIIQAILFNLYGVKILSIYEFDYGNIKLDYRSFGIRLIASDLVEFSPAVSLGLLFSKPVSKKLKKISIINLGTVITYIIFVSQTRSILYMYLLLFVILLYFSNRKANIRKILLIAVAITVIGVFSEEIFEFISGIYNSIVFRTDYSFYHRFDSYSYYFEQGLKNPVFGIGLLPDSPDVSQYRLLVHGLRGYGYSDVGIFGLFGKLGIIPVLFYIYLIYLTYKASRKTGSNKVCFSITVSMVYSCVNLSLFDAERILVLTIFLAIVNNIYQDYENNKRRIRDYYS